MALTLRGEDRPFALIGRWAGGGALIGSRPVAVAPPDADPFAVLEAMPAVTAGDGVALAADSSPRPDAVVGGGWFGYLGYRLGAAIESLDPPPPPAGPELPRFELAFYDHLLHLDGQGRWWFEALLDPSREAEIAQRLERFRGLELPGAGAPPGSRPFRTEPWRASPSPAGHARAVAACRERIHAGDLFQANICQRLSSRLLGEPLDLFLTGADRLGPDRSAYLEGPWGAVASFSPELFLERHGRRVRTAPIKGTRPRPENDPERAAAQRQELADSAKDRAENQMIVDMARNDLGRVCSYGSVTVEVSAEPRPHTGVWHLVSEVSGRLHDGLGDRDLLRATFPPASVTGAPKIAAENVIAELESSRREIYTGAIGFASPILGLELSVAIRSFEFGPPDPDGGSGRVAWLGVGGGIVADSDPVAEGEECRTKAKPLLVAIGAELEPTSSPSDSRRTDEALDAPLPAPPRPLRLGALPVPRPDPALGVFETMLVRDGKPQHLELHLARLEASLGALYGMGLPDDLEAEIRERAATRGEPGRLRLDLRPEGEGIAREITLSDLPARPSPLRLVPVCMPGGLGAHKWADRRLLDRLGGAVAGDGLPLICDLDGAVLEAAHANLFADLGDGRLVTPPADGRILPGIARALLLTGEIAPPPDCEGIAESGIDLAQLAQARAIFLSNSLVSLVPAVLAAGEEGIPLASRRWLR